MWWFMFLIIFFFIYLVINLPNERNQYDEDIKKMSKANGELVKFRNNINNKSKL